MKNVLIIGKDSYIGEHLQSWLAQYPDTIHSEIVSPLNGAWKQADFSQFDTVVDFAGIAHVNMLSEELKPLFYSVNRDLTAELGAHAKEAGVRHFVIFSSMNVYGEMCSGVTDRTKTAPTNFYGDSKLQGDLALFAMEDEAFHVSCIRPPFVYGNGCRGNYNKVAKLAKKLPVFPDYPNQKSMIYVDNLCEFVRLTIENELYGILTPQNRELVSTATLVQAIAAANGKSVCLTKAFNWSVPLLIKTVGAARKAFGDDCYDLALSDYFDFAYCVVSFEESIRRTENASR